jgi:hypothetical protein
MSNREPYKAPATEPPPWQLYRATVEPYGSTRWGL